MAKCPKCNTEIPHLDVKVKEVNYYTFTISEWPDSKNPDKPYISSDYNDAENMNFDICYFYCPECRAQLDILPTQEAGIEFLKEKGTSC